MTLSDQNCSTELFSKSVLSEDVIENFACGKVLVLLFPKKDLDIGLWQGLKKALKLCVRYQKTVL